MSVKVILQVYYFNHYHPGFSYAENYIAIYFVKTALISPQFDYMGMPQEAAINPLNTPITTTQQVLQLQLRDQIGFSWCRIGSKLFEKINVYQAIWMQIRPKSM